MVNAIVGKDVLLIKSLTQAIARAADIRFNVSFLMESGAKLIAPHLRDAAARGVQIKILTGRYMGVTEPSAIYYLMDMLEESLDIRFFADTVLSFHPKAYLFEYRDEAEVFVGSSNLSLSALTWGLEWNYRLLKSQNIVDYEKFSETFDTLFHDHSEKITPTILKQYASTWRKPELTRIENSMEQDHLEGNPEITPQGAQIEALYELRKAREEGIDRGLVVAATGVGKTYLSAFDSMGFDRVLFVAHRDEILKQASHTF